MKIFILLVFVSIVLVASAVAFFAWTVREQTFDHTDRLALLPLEGEQTVPACTHKREGKHGDSTDRL